MAFSSIHTAQTHAEGLPVAPGSAHFAGQERREAVTQEVGGGAVPGLNAAGRSWACRTEGHSGGSVNCLCGGTGEPRITAA